MSNFAITIEEDKPGSGSAFQALMAFIFIMISELQSQKKQGPRHIYRGPKHHKSPKIALLSHLLSTLRWKMDVKTQHQVKIAISNLKQQDGKLI